MSTTIRKFEIGEYADTMRSSHTIVPDPTWEQFLESWTRAQNRGRQFAGLTIMSENGSTLWVDGSDGLFFALYSNADGFQFQPLPDPAYPECEVTVILGGVNTTLPRAFLFDEATLLRVVWDYWQGQLDVSTGWEPL